MLYVIQLGPRLARIGERITRVELVEVGENCGGRNRRKKREEDNTREQEDCVPRWSSCTLPVWTQSPPCPT